MEYYTTEDQEKRLYEEYMEKIRKNQDMIRGSREYGRKVIIHQQFRTFFVNNGKVYLEWIGDENECPMKYVSGGKSYQMDYDYTDKVYEFIKKHPNYMIVFTVSSGTENVYHGGRGVYPARMVGDFEELMVEDMNKYIIQTL